MLGWLFEALRYYEEGSLLTVIEDARSTFQTYTNHQSKQNLEEGSATRAMRNTIPMQE